ncbi:unnamed protein product [Rotaria sp. Silwood2]|nr:unnamed protein product [Rotaria sp. Silwood2]CAF4088511.1 unnamed protein product [Rotaria sp. Silwood2]
MDILRHNRWIVILGDLGSSKTTLLRWITFIFAELALNGHEKLVLEGEDCIPVRIPILVRIGEFATWLKQYPTKTLIDYMGEHTWDSKRYCHDDNKNVLKELIDDGHTLILLDGLDEITEVGQKGEIVDLVRKFVDEYARGPDFISAFDDRMFHGTSVDYCCHKIVETQPPSIPGGNQIIITSRIIGYQLYPLVVEVYNHAVQVALHSWKSHELNIPERVLTNFLIDLACYLHLNSSSGLIDEFDIKQLCYLILQQQGLSCNHKILREYVHKLTSLLDYNIGIFAERGLQIYEFLHLSFQDYFVARSLVKGSPDEVAKRILTITIYPRFHESLLIAIGWISWKWSFDDYDILPSNSVIFITLSNILDHPYYPKWMQTQLKDEKRLSNFCQCLLQNVKEFNDKIQTNQKSIPSAVYQELWLLHNISTSAELIIDQTLRIIMRSAKNV